MAHPTPSPTVAVGDTRNAAFATTRWTMVLDVSSTDGSHAHAALEELCRIYWRPIYSFLRQLGRSPHDAQDLTQAFLAHLIAAPALARVDPARGRFRSFLLACLKHFLANEQDRVHTLKRGGRVQHLPLASLADTEAGHIPAADPVATTLPPDAAFDRQWALSLLERVLERLAEEHATAGKGALFAHLRDTLVSTRSSLPYAALAQKLGMSEGAIKVTIHRLRRRYRELLRQEVAHTLEDPGAAEEELQHLFAALGR